jgi:hypothetical protein
VITTLVASAGPSSGAAAGGTMVNHFWHDSAGQLVSAVPSVPPRLINNLSAIDGVTGVTVIHRNPAVQPDQPGPDGLVLCAQLTHTPVIGKCPRGATVVAIDSTFGNGFGRKQPSTRSYGRLLRLPQKPSPRYRCMHSSSAQMDLRRPSRARARSWRTPFLVGFLPTRSRR